jgi:hypothetical protein
VKFSVVFVTAFLDRFERFRRKRGVKLRVFRRKCGVKLIVVGENWELNCAL